MVNKIILLDREFRLGLGFLNLLIEGTGKDLITLGNEVQTNAPVIVPQMMYYALAYAHKRANTELELSIDDVYDLIDENGGVSGAFWNDFLIAFAKSMNQDVPVDESKKKEVKTKK
jgi:hypothetical protein